MRCECGYSLEGLRGAVCPESGRAIVASLVRARRGVSGWVVMGLVVGAVGLVAFSCVMWLERVRSPVGPLSALPVIVGTVFWAVGAVPWIAVAVGAVHESKKRLWWWVGLVAAGVAAHPLVVWAMVWGMR
jgi:hypothetical protein